MKHEMTLRATIGLMSLWGLLACGSAPEAATAVAANGKPDGAQLYDMCCTLCHGGDGKLGINGAKDLTASLLSREEMIAVVFEALMLDRHEWATRHTQPDHLST